MGRGWEARSRMVSVVFGEMAELMTEWTQVETEGPILGERVEQTMRAILIVGSAMLVRLAAVQLEINDGVLRKCSSI